MFLTKKDESYGWILHPFLGILKSYGEPQESNREVTTSWHSRVEVRRKFSQFHVELQKVLIGLASNLVLIEKLKNR